ncbi:hypothetical protein XENOCAPTIV_018314, partial [Xenoophorus captivus]
MMCCGPPGECEWSMGLLTAGSLGVSVGELQRVLKTAVVLGEQVVQKTRLKMDRFVSGTEASCRIVIHVTAEVMVMAEVSSKEKLH